MKPIAGRIAGLSLLILSVACSKSDDVTGPSSGTTAAAYVTAVSSGTSSGVFNPSTVPVAAGGPVITVSGNVTAINGGTNPVTIGSTTALSKVYVSVNGVPGYYDVPVSGTGTSVSLVLSLAVAIPTATFDLAFSGVSSGGAVGTPAVLSSRVTSVGTGDVQISLSWDRNSDADLHVVDPSGEEIYWGNRRSASGGKLDLDSNSGCNIDGQRNENITWATGTAPRGTYTVRVDLWGACTTTGTNFVVRVNQNGAATNSTGTLSGPGDLGGRGSGTLVTTFTH